MILLGNFVKFQIKYFYSVKQSVEKPLFFLPSVILMQQREGERTRSHDRGDDSSFVTTDPRVNFSTFSQSTCLVFIILRRKSPLANLSLRTSLISRRDAREKSSGEPFEIAKGRRTQTRRGESRKRKFRDLYPWERCLLSYGSRCLQA